MAAAATFGTRNGLCDLGSQNLTILGVSARTFGEKHEHWYIGGKDSSSCRKLLLLFLEDEDTIYLVCQCNNRDLLVRRDPF